MRVAVRVRWQGRKQRIMDVSKKLDIKKIHVDVSCPTTVVKRVYVHGIQFLPKGLLHDDLWLV